ncbi:cupin domain-containing protein [Rhizobium hainanense]|uniref:ChrR-like cupin domain-containing protein n=1 Tax=Rhizobium hainanense TaxID=52131 RepID=A0A1C3W8Z7_9HYPH|nr:DUF4437 domain-containing protein [Rhizobium hainanense]SCB36345.1 hypothetical protein GA0061100_11355 [Rhizobium hainanense]
MDHGYFALDTNSMAWDILEVPEINGKLPLKTCKVDEETGVAIWKIKYPAGYTTVSHWHNCSHGIYVLDGILRTHAGEYGPGTFVWFPEGTIQSHGATEIDDVTFLFITNKSFDIHFTHLEGAPA